MLVTALIYLSAVVIAVPLSKRFGLGVVLGYLIAGIIIGPSVLKAVGSQKEVMHFAEFGVVMMLFLIGLELQPSKLWQLKKNIIGLGGLQMGLTTALIFTGLYFFDLSWQTRLVIALTLSLSSTAIVIQSLQEGGQLKTEAGNNAFSVLLFQDIAVIPLLAILPLLALAPVDMTGDNSHSNLLAHLPGWQKAIAVVAIMAAIFVLGKYLSAPIFRFIAETRSREVFTALALFIVVAISVLMSTIGLSPALGAFLAGVVLADSEFRHEVEVNIEPFKSMLLGLFFITVGASIDFNLMIQRFDVVIAAVFALMIVKCFALFVVSQIFHMGKKQAGLFAVVLAQGGEFAFVVLSAAMPYSLLTDPQANMLNLIVAVSMFLSPIILIAYERILSSPPAQLDHDIENQDFAEESEVIIAGYGRFGQIVGRLLSATGYQLNILDHSPSQVDLIRRFGSKVFYGDASRLDLLEAAGAERAGLIVIAVDEPDKAIEIVQIVQKHFPHMKIIVRSIDRRHTYELLKLNVDHVIREVFGSSLEAGISALKCLGVAPNDANRIGALFRNHDEQGLEQMAELWGDDNSYGVAVRQRMEDLTQVLEDDKKTLEHDIAKEEGIDHSVLPSCKDPHS